MNFHTSSSVSDASISVLGNQTVCYVYPNGEVLVGQQISSNELVRISPVVHNYNLLKKLQRYQYKHQPAERSRSVA